MAKASRRKVKPPASNAEVIQAGEQAERILGDDTFQYAVNAAEELFIREWRGATEPEKREMAWAKMHALDEVLRMLQSIMDHGKLTTARITRDPR